MYPRCEELFIPDKITSDAAFKRTTHLAIGAHQDDLEIMAWHGISQCLEALDKWFGGVVVTDGAGSPANGKYAALSKDELRALRNDEQKKAAMLGRYSFIYMPGYPSSTVRNCSEKEVAEILSDIIIKAQPEIIYTHSPFDRHDTHVAVFLRVIEALKGLAGCYKPVKLYGCEVWRSLDWLDSDSRVSLDCSKHPDVSTGIIRVFDSQIGSGKFYDKAVEGRRLANATFDDAYKQDASSSVSYAVDLMPLLEGISVMDFVSQKIDSFCKDVKDRIVKLA